MKTHLEALSEAVDDRIRVSIRNGDGWTEYSYPAAGTGELGKTFRSAVAAAVAAFTGRAVAEVNFARRVGDGCGAYLATLGA